MSKISIDDSFDEDFGFSAVSEEELKALEKRLAADVQAKTQQLKDVETSYRDKLEQLHKAIMPLLYNLQKNPDKEYIYWPNRAEKVKEFIVKVNRIVKDE